MVSLAIYEFGFANMRSSHVFCRLHLHEHQHIGSLEVHWFSLLENIVFLRGKFDLKVRRK